MRVSKIKISAEALSGHNLIKGDQCNEPNFGVRKFLERVHVCAKFHENRKGSRFFILLFLIWYGMTLLLWYVQVQKV